jgi:hypothetical protein
MKQIDRSRLRVAIELPDPDPVAHKDYVDRLDKVASALDQLAEEDPGLYGSMNSEAIRYFQIVTTTAASSGRLFLFHLDEMACVACLLAECGFYRYAPEKGIYEIASPTFEYSAIRRSALALLETMDEMGDWHPEFILTCVEAHDVEASELDLDEVDGRYDAAVRTAQRRDLAN